MWETVCFTALRFGNMITTRFFLDCRQSKPGIASPLKIVLTKNGVRTLISTGISLLPSQWDSYRQLVVSHPRKQQFNMILSERKLTVDNLLYRLVRDGELAGLKASEIRRRVEIELFPEKLPTKRVGIFGGKEGNM